MHREEWKLPLNIAIGCHIIVAVSCIYGPHIFDSKPKHEQIYTVDLTNFADPSPPQQAPKSTPPPEKITATKKVARKVAPIAKAAPEPTPEAAPKKAISLKPQKRKIKKKITPQQKPKTNNNEKIRRQKLAEALRAQQVAEEAAKIAQQEAELERKLMEANLADARRVVQENNSRQTSNSGSNSSSSASALSGIQKQYLNAIVSHLHGYWQLPEHKSWSSTLATTVAVTVSANGKVKSMYIEQGSGDRVFDQFVLKALRAADPLPNIPPAMRKKQFDIGLVFKPGSIQ